MQSAPLLFTKQSAPAALSSGYFVALPTSESGYHRQYDFLDGYFFIGGHTIMDSEKKSGISRRRFLGSTAAIAAGAVAGGAAADGTGGAGGLRR